MNGTTLHNEACKHAFDGYEQAKAEYERQWPNHCRECNGYGGFSSSYDPSPAGVGLASGWMQDFDTCSACVDEGRCPRCAGSVEDDASVPCARCGWTADTSGAPAAPECLCWAGEL